MHACEVKALVPVQSHKQHVGFETKKVMAVRH